MSVLVASDIHGSVRAASFLADTVAEKKPTLVLLLGDLLYHGPRNKLPDSYDAPQTAKILSSISVPVAAMAGNCDAEVDQLLLPWILVETGYFEFNQKLFLTIHGHQLPLTGGNWTAVPSGQNIIFGHTHLPLAAFEKGRHLWNPGSLGIPKGGYPPSYGWFEDGIFKVLSMEGQVLMADPI
jgi:putative phosphoesterase